MESGDQHRLELTGIQMPPPTLRGMVVARQFLAQSGQQNLAPVDDPRAPESLRLRPSLHPTPTTVTKDQDLLVKFLVLHGRSPSPRILPNPR